MLSLTSAKSGALIGVLISVTTIPAAANIGVAGAYGDAGEALGAASQLAINLAAIVLAGVMTLFIQRRFYVSRRKRHLDDPMRTAARAARRDRSARKDEGPLERRPDVDLRAHPRDHLAGELAGGGVPPRSGVRTPVAVASSTDS